MILTSAILGPVAAGLFSRAEATPRVYQSAQGLGVSIGTYFVQFAPNGKLLRGGQKCDDVQLYEAKQVVKEYLQKHGGNASGSQPRIYQSAWGVGVLIDDCFVQFDPNRNLLAGGQKCDDIELNNANKAVRNYHAN